MLFQDEHIGDIKTGEKTATRRDWADNYHGPKVGSIVAATTELFTPDDEAECFIRITDRYQQPLGEMTDADARAEGDYRTVDEFKDIWVEINGEWKPDLVVDVVEFRYVGPNRPAKDELRLAKNGGDIEYSRNERCERCGRGIPKVGVYKFPDGEVLCNFHYGVRRGYVTELIPTK